MLSWDEAQRPDALVSTEEIISNPVPFISHQAIPILKTEQSPSTNSTLISASHDNTIKIWNTRSRQIVTTLRGHTGFVNSIELLSNNRLASGSEDRTIIIWSLDYNYFPLIRLESIHQQPVRCLKYFRDHKLISASDDRTIRIINLHNYQVLNTLLGHENNVECLELLSNNRLASGSRDNTIRVWNIADIENVEENNNQRQLRVFQEHISNIKVLKLVNENVLLSGSDDGTVRMWDLNNYLEITPELDTDSPIESMCILDVERIAIGCLDGSILIYSFQNRQTVLLQDDGNNSVQCIVKLFNYVNQFASGYGNRKIIIWNYLNKENIRNLEEHLRGVNDMISIENNELASASDDRTIIIWNIDTGEKLDPILRGHTDDVVSLKFY